MKWDVKDIKEWEAARHPAGATIPASGNAVEYKTGNWRTERPVWHEDICSQCMICWVFCPDSSIEVAEGKMTSIDYDHCKGCGICATECPRDAISMEPEER